MRVSAQTARDRFQGLASDSQGVVRWKLLIGRDRSANFLIGRMLVTFRRCDGNHHWNTATPSLVSHFQCGVTSIGSPPLQEKC